MLTDVQYSDERSNCAVFYEFEDMTGCGLSTARNNKGAHLMLGVSKLVSVVNGVRMHLLFLAFSLIAAIAVPPGPPSHGVELRVLTPMHRSVIYGNTITVRLETPGLTVIPRTFKPRMERDPDINQRGQGVVLLALDLHPVKVWDSSAPYTLLNVPPGDHVLTVEVVQNDLSSFSPPVWKQLVFTTYTS